MADEPNDQTTDEQPDTEAQPHGAPDQPAPDEKPAPEKKPGPDPLAEARKWEKRSKENKAALDKAAADLEAEKARTANILKAAGITPENEDPAKVAERVQAERDAVQAERDQARAEAKALKRERVAERAALTVGADPEVVRESRGLAERLAALEDDATDDDVTRTVAEYVEANQRWKAAPASPRPPSASRGQGTSDQPPPSAASLAAEAEKKGDHRGAIAAQLRKLAPSSPA